MLPLSSRKQHPLQSLRRVHRRRLLSRGRLLILRLRGMLVVCLRETLMLRRLVGGHLGVLRMRLRRSSRPHALTERSSKGWACRLAVIVAKFVAVKRAAGVVSCRRRPSSRW